MLKKITLLTLAFCLMLSCFPGTAFAAAEGERTPETAQLMADEDTSARSLDVVNQRELDNAFAFDVQMSGECTGKLIVAVYSAAGQMRFSKSYSPAALVEVVVDRPEADDYAKVMWVDDSCVPLCGHIQLSLHIPVITSNPLDEDHIAQAELPVDGTLTDALYVDNEVLLEAVDGATLEEIEALVSGYGGTVAGIHEELNHYQITFENIETLEQLNGLIQQLAASPLIDDADLNTVYEIEAEAAHYRPNDDWGGLLESILNEGKPRGYNWGLEAINVPSAQGLLLQRYQNHWNDIPQVTIGILDTMFDQTHPDLSLNGCWGFHRDLSSYVYTEHTRELAGSAQSENEYIDCIHGTHVAGIIGALAYNGGISGIALRAKLYGFSLAQTYFRYLQNGHLIQKKKGFFASEFNLEHALDQLFSQDPSNDLIINYSAKDDIPKDKITKLLKKELQKRPDFLIVASAGNEYDSDATTTSGFCKVDDPELVKHIIVVGAAYSQIVRQETFSEYDYNNFGFLNKIRVENNQDLYYNYGPRIDVVAPGYSIYSCVSPNANSWGSSGKEYKIESGTSMAAPHATGVAALVWAANPDLTPARVKEILIQTSDIPLLNHDTAGSSHNKETPDYMLNAAHAVSAARNIEYSISGKYGADSYDPETADDDSYQERSYGQNIDWTFDPVSRCLQLSGTGLMFCDNDNLEYSPWYRYKSEIKSIEIGDGVESIGDYAFYDLPNLTEVKLGKQVKTIGKHAFEACRKLQTVTWESSLTAIGEYAFCDCPALTRLPVFPKSVETISSGAFLDTGVKEYHFLGSAPTVAAANATDPSFALGSNPHAATIYYLAENKTWNIIKNELTGDETWMGYPAKPEQLTITGIAVNQLSGQPVAEAQVTLWNMDTGEQAEQVKTDKQGRFTAGVPGTPPATLKLEISAEGYEAVTETKQVDDFRFAWPELSLKPLTVPVTVTLLDPDGAPVSGVRITGYDVPYNCSRTDANGKRTVSVAPGKYTFEASTELPGPEGWYVPYYATQTVSVFGETELTLTLHRARLEWYYNDSSKVLSIWGEGPMPDYSRDWSPWEQHKREYTRVEITGLTSIGRNAFQNSSALTDVSISNSVTTIGDSAFSNCTSLTYITIPGSVTCISSAFEDCTKLGSAFLEGVIWSGGGNFSGCTSLSWVSLPGSLKYIGNSDFSGCTGLKDIYIPYGVERINGGAFYGCGSLAELTIPASVTNIEGAAFWGCRSLTKITIPENVEKIGYYTFSGCENLRQVTVCGDKAVCSRAFPDGAVSLSFAEGVTAIPEEAYQDCKGLIDVTLPDSVTTLSKSAFRYCSGLTALSIPGTIKTIGNSAFDGCGNLASVFLGDGVTAIGYLAFNGCGGLTRVFLPESLTVIGDYAFSGCNNLFDFTLPSELTAIGDGAFQGCSRLTEITIPEKVISTSGFSNCPNLKNVTITGSGTVCAGDFCGSTQCTVTVAEGVTALPPDAFRDCGGLIRAELPSSLRSIGDHAFAGCYNLAEVRIPDGVSAVGDYLFYDCKALTGITLPDSITSIGTKAFYSCQELTEVTLPEALTSIGADAFHGCQKLTGITLPDTLTSIGSRAFQECYMLTEINIPKSVSSVGKLAFAYCSLTATVNSSTTMCPNAFTNGSVTLILAEDMTEIADGAFSDCESLTEVLFPSGLSSIGKNAFEGCRKLASLTVPGTVRTIQSNTFNNCTGLTSLTLSEGLESIDFQAFRDCSALTSLSIPASVSVVARNAFEGCKKLTEVTVCGDTTVCERAFPSGAIHLVFSGSVTKIPHSAFMRCTGVTSVSIPDGVTAIESGAFVNCTGLKTIVFASPEAPDAENFLTYVTATAYYPNTWTAPPDKAGGTITWVPYDPAVGVPE